MRRTRAKLVTLALRDEIGRVRLQTLRVPYELVSTRELRGARNLP